MIFDTLETPTNIDTWRSLYLCEPKPTDHRLVDLAIEYATTCEAFDRTVCTGPVIHGEIMPATNRETYLITRHAIATFNAIAARADNLGLSRRDLLKEISHARPC